jgi:hypothetical protein
MAVILANRMLTVHKRAHPQARDAHGTPIPQTSDTVTTVGPFPGAAQESADGSWTLRLDPRTWRVREEDNVTDDQGNTWIIVGRPRLNQVPGASDVDFVRAQGTLEPPLVP